MHVWRKQKLEHQKFNFKCYAYGLESLLEIPDGKNPQQHAWLTISINYGLDFVDSRNPSGLVYLKDGKYVVKNEGNEFPVKDWNESAKNEFVKKFEEGEKFWNYKFMLRTPSNYDGLDFTHWTNRSDSWVCRPNVLCLFRLKKDAQPNHQWIKVVRVNDKKFRSDNATYDEDDVNEITLFHELGHALGLEHIQALLGNKKCLDDKFRNDSMCYDELPGVTHPNVMGRGKSLTFVNAEPWRQLIAHHTDTARTSWHVIMSNFAPPRKIPLGFQTLNVMPNF